ncbi:hypothetical protein SLG_10350 [Sphingobium sp. SYK-6]|uniref:DUF2934 domain-containing protein n=1 Tax=Sphingobium sp. (strain NBRC 103272 / SYK-6) TaxID=627192 RepID=UPI000227666B|nr:DUF2934 domain-containing protein [Sphingobium sp. SYK-6]BAK65710.1 hypothetical protein SLG_10350 [Sphingobium sp. SYK-6]
MSEDRDQTIKDRAYAIWEAEGRPDGRSQDHWLRAEQELDGDAAPSFDAAQQAVAEQPEPSPEASEATPAAPRRAGRPKKKAPAV